ncbi:MAG: KAP family NTPase [Flavobacterium sp.]|jgi:hypothetical protein|nr:KAP family NTPase [Flavobacterium sp.]
MKKISTLLDSFLEDRKLQLIAILLSLPIILPKKFNNLLNKYITEPILSNIESNIGTDFIALAITFLIFYSFYKKSIKAYSYSVHSYILVGGCMIWYWIYRLNGKWNFPKFSFYKNGFISYTDLIVVSVFLSFLLVINTAIKSERKRKKDSKNANIDSFSGFLIDSPIDNSDDDKLDRKAYAQTILEKIYYSFPHKESIGIGIIGEWGSGKTSFVNLIKEYINENDDKIIIEFKPWNSFDSKNIIVDFFDIFRDKLKDLDSKISFQFKDYADKLTSLDDNILTKSIKVLTDIIEGEKVTNEKFDAINETINRINKQIIIFIDDIDRLDKKEIIEILKLIRVSANFKNTVFIVAYDRTYIGKAIQEFNDANTELFLEKIFQIEIPLPVFDSSIITQNLIQKLSERLPESLKEDLEVYFQKTFDENALTNIKDYITSIRDVNKLVNNVVLSYQMLGDNIYINDLIDIELIRLKYPTFYRELYFNRNIFWEMSPSDRDLKLRQNKGNTGFIVKEYLDKNYSLLGIPQNKIVSIVTTLELLFKDYRWYLSENKKSIRYVRYFHRYFSLRLFTNEISHLEFEAYRTKNIDEFKQKVQEWVSMGNDQALLHLFKESTPANDKEDYEKFIEVLFYFFEIKRENYFPTDYHLIYKKICEYRWDEELKKYTQDLISEKFYQNDKERKAFIYSFFSEFSYPYKLQRVSFLGRILDKEIPYKFVLESNEISEIIMRIVQEYLNEKKNIDSTFWNIFYELRKAKDVSSETGAKNDYYFDSNAKSFLKAILKQYDGWYGFFINEHNKTLSLSIKLINNFFDDYKDFENFLDELPKTEMLNKFIKFCKKSNENNFSEIPFEYKEIIFKD